MKRVIMHPKHSGNFDGLNDIGLVELEEPIHYPRDAFLDSSEYFDTVGKTLARPVCLANKEYTDSFETMSGDARCYKAFKKWRSTDRDLVIFCHSQNNFQPKQYYFRKHIFLKK